MSVNQDLLRMILGANADSTKIISMINQEAALNDQSTVDVTTGNKILLPRGMNKLDGSKELRRQWNDDESVIEVNRSFGRWMPHDVLVAVKKAAEKSFGYIHGKTIRGFFGDDVPSEISVVVDIVDGKEVTLPCFYGHMEISAWEGAVMNIQPNGISCSVKKRWKGEVNKFYDVIAEFLRTESVYRGKAVSVTSKSNGEIDFSIFETKVNNRIFLNQDVRLIIDNFIVPQIEEPQKRISLFSGPYGNGKTETALTIGHAAKEQGLVFFYCKDTASFEKLLEVAVDYQPAVIFMEDVDEIGSGTRDRRLNNLFNTLDGVQTKGKNVNVIFTTNNEQDIHPALRRPGRIDVVTNFANPTTETAARILESYWSEYCPADMDYVTVASEIGDVSGAVIAEIAKRGVQLASATGKLTKEQGLAAIHSMRHHIQLMNSADAQAETSPKFVIQINKEGDVAGITSSTEVLQAAE